MLVEFPEVVGISHYEKLWNHLDKRELRDFRSTNVVVCKNLQLKKSYISAQGIENTKVLIFKKKIPIPGVEPGPAG